MAHRAHHTFSFTNDKGESSGVVYGVPFILSSLLRKFKPDECYAIFDGNRAPERLALHPAYKERPDSLGDEADSFHEQLKVVRKVLRHLGVKVMCMKNREADDLIYAIARQKKGNYITIVSSDKDFVQMLDPLIKIWNPFKEKLIHIENVMEVYGFSPEECVDYLCLQGDKSDNIPGVSGMGPKRIRAFLNDYESISDWITWPVADSRFDKYPIEEVYKFNRPLISLGYFYRTHLRGVELVVKEGKFKLKKVLALVRPYGIKTFSKPNFLKSFDTLR